MEENFRLELLSMIDRFADDNTVMMIDGCVCRLLRKYDVSEKHTEICVLENENEKILNTYRASLRLEGRSPSTIYQYMDSIKHTLDVSPTYIVFFVQFSLIFVAASTVSTPISETTDGVVIVKHNTIAKVLINFFIENLPI